MSLPTLYSLHVSPWSERARWALQHHGVAFKRVDHMPVLGERKLRKVVGPGRRATVPVLVTDEGVLRESWDIALYADRVGSASKLVPKEQEAEVRTWADLADRAMQAGRVLVVAGLLATPAALDESGPPGVPGFLRPMMRPIARQATRAFGKKYEVNLDDLETPRRTMRAALEEVRKALAGKPYLLSAFSYADVAIATLVQGISPVSDDFLRLGPGTRAAWTQPELAREFADLVTWRDGVYARERKKKKATA